ncbi:MAG: diguanylate cyclase protein, partial [Eubacterium sp.]|nr:diguanylate cyclase protein [Eubacterium sp.]
MLLKKRRWLIIKNLMKDLEEKNDERENLLSDFPFLKCLHKYGNSFSPKKHALRIAAVYIAMGCFWVLLSDRIVHRIFTDKKVISLISIVKGWFFVIASGLVLYTLIYYTLKRINQAEKKVMQSYDELSATYEELEASYEEIAASEEEIKQQFDSLQTYSDIITASENRLNRAQRIAKVGNWELDIASDTLWASDEAYHIYGIKRENNSLPFQNAKKQVNKNDKKRINQALKLLLENNEKYDVVFRINRLEDGNERIIHSVAQLEFDR